MLSWDPMRELQREFDGLFTGPSGTVHQFPAVNVWANENEAFLSAELPGVQADDLNISVVGEQVTFSGKCLPVEAQNAEYHRRERLHGEFNRALKLPFRVDADKVEASVNKGVLTVKLPRAEEDKPRKIAIKAA